MLVASGVYIGDIPPAMPKPGQLWWESDTGTLFIYYDDGSSQQWVQAINDKSVMDKISIVGNGSVASPHSVGTVDCGTWV